MSRTPAGPGADIPAAVEFALHGRNPAQGPTAIAYGVPLAHRGDRLEIAIFDLAGRQIRTLAEGAAEPGRFERVWDLRSDGGATVRSGAYFVSMRIGREARMKTAPADPLTDRGTMRRGRARGARAVRMHPGRVQFHREQDRRIMSGMAPSRTRLAPSLPVLASIAAALLFGASTPLAKALLSSLGPFTLAGLLYLGGAIGALPFAFRGGSAKLRHDPRQRRLLGLAVIFGGGAAPVLLLLGLRAAPAASVSLWLNTEVVATALLAWTLFHENLDRRTVLAAGLILAGGMILAAPEGAAGWKAGALVAGACVCWGVDNNLTALVSGFTPAQTTLAKGLIAGTVNLVLGLLLGQHLPGPARVGAALGVGAVSYGWSIMLYIFGAQHLGATRSQLLFATAPFLGVLLAWTLFHEPVQPAQLAAIPFIAAGLYFMLTAQHEHEHTHEAMAHTHSHRHDDGHHTHVHPGLPAWVRHTHAHEHEPLTHRHPHVPDLHHRHEH